MLTYLSGKVMELLKKVQGLFVAPTVNLQAWTQEIQDIKDMIKALEDDAR